MGGLQSRFLSRRVLAWLASLGALLQFTLAIFFEAPSAFVLLGLLTLVIVVMLVIATSKAEPVALRVETARAPPAFRRALDALPAPTILIDRRAVVVHANRAAPEAFPGLRPGFPVSTVFRDPDLLAAIDRLLRGVATESLELVEPVPFERSFHVTLHRLYGDGTSPAADDDSVAVIHLMETTQARRAERMRVDFVANASHELRTPLASILGFVETLQGPAKDDPVARVRFLGIMATQAQRMTRLINDLLSLSRIEMRAHIRPQDQVDLALVLPGLADTLSGLALERKTRMTLKLDEGDDLVIPGDRDELTRLCENLIENAIKYGGTAGRVEITCRRHGNQVELSVRDHGPGIGAEHIPRLTERFYRVDVQESRVMGGTGLGLAIVKHIVTRHRGKLEIESRSGEGALFRVLLPSDNS
ncbi:BaeS Signal transduction histidine kinase [Rhabdaerophilaceae bacterium]